MCQNVLLSEEDRQSLLEHVDGNERSGAGDALDRNDWIEYFRTVSKSDRLQCFSILENSLADTHYFRVLGWVWVNGEKHHIERPGIINLFEPTGRDAGLHIQMMSADERLTYDALPTTVTVFRGAEDEEALNGWSWTQSLDIARMFAGTGGYVRTGRCNREDVIAFKHGPEGESQAEDELIINPTNIRDPSDDHLGEIE